jgi:hypothetical protein
MMGHSIYAAWFRAREKRLRSLCAHLHIPILLHNQVLIDFDITDISTPGDFVRKIAANTKEIPFRLCAHRMSLPEKNELIYQVNRLLDEEASEVKGRSVII